MWKGFSAYGICNESEMPYAKSFDAAREPSEEIRSGAKARLKLGLERHWIKEWDVKTGLTDEQLLGIRRKLRDGWPVCGGFRWPNHAAWNDGVLQMCDAGQVFDGHSVLLVGYRDDAKQAGGGVFIFRNTSSGGVDGMMTYEYARTYMNDALWIDAP
jgi:hypothetical protein